MCDVKRTRRCKRADCLVSGKVVGSEYAGAHAALFQSHKLRFLYVRTGSHIWRPLLRLIVHVQTVQLCTYMYGCINKIKVRFTDFGNSYYSPRGTTGFSNVHNLPSCHMVFERSQKNRGTSLPAVCFSKTEKVKLK